MRARVNRGRTRYAHGATPKLARGQLRNAPRTLAVRCGFFAQTPPGCPETHDANGVMSMATPDGGVGRGRRRAVVRRDRDSRRRRRGTQRDSSRGNLRAAQRALRVGNRGRCPGAIVRSAPNRPARRPRLLRESAISRPRDDRRIGLARPNLRSGCGRFRAGARYLARPYGRRGRRAGRSGLELPPGFGLRAPGFGARTCSR